MQSLEAGTAAPANRTTLHLALAAFADEAVGTLARLIAYVGSLVLFAILALAALGHLPALHDDAPVAQPGWSAADRSHPAFAVTRLDSIDKSVSYTILRHPRGGRRDLIRWSGETDTPLAELEIYREGEEFDLARPSTEALAARMGLQPAALEQAGLIDTSMLVLLTAVAAILLVDKDSVLFIEVAPPQPGAPLFSSAAERAYLVLGCLIGAAGGPLQAASRTLLIRLAPKDRIAQYFGLFALTGKVTSFIGPLLIGVITAVTASQKAGMAVLVVFFVTGLALLMRVRE